MIIRQSTLKQCRDCGQDKPKDAFYTRTNGSLRQPCKPCYTEECRQRRLADPAKYAAHARNWRATPRGRHSPLWQKYRLTLEQYEAMLVEQNNACLGCLVTFTKTPHVDHCHATGKVRGLLCGPCNRAIGQASESAEVLRRLADYVEAHQ